ncbi:hypothetical protein Aph01nite_56460 [Acrocarpospora phusangensis]|uniref:Uncharacterized protein n=1 Tax=Acrocarpospora phusangensis TaxID=1070424 RepID=A0A919QG96_9ACTN|nr:hypothetical protein [Acrocarpospora phusangensis]GIH27336.1 hypothetical protein Aph01nite_56460 [Acrocarpospora phusangensis]
MGYELRVEREIPLGYTELAKSLSADTSPEASEAGFELRGLREAGEVVVRFGDATHTVATWATSACRLVGEPASDWQLAQLAVLSGLVGGRLTGEDGEVYAVRDGILEQVSGSSTLEFGKLEELLAAGPSSWSE